MSEPEIEAGRPPAHHRPDGRFRNPWPEAARDGALRKRIHRVAWEWLTRRTPAAPAPGALTVVEPNLADRVGEGEVRITWIGHATFLVQLPGLNVLTDPMWSERASPVPGGFRRFVPPAFALTRLPPIDVVLLSHDHFDHLDQETVLALHSRFGDALTWLTPLGYRRWVARRGVARVTELDWWERADLPGGAFEAVAAPARHWTRRAPWGTNTRLWCSWAVRPTGPRGPRVYFGGDSGYASVFAEIGARLGPFDASLLPIGAYEPRWFMGAAHVTPEASPDLSGYFMGTIQNGLVL
jgi:N-acyl-phosphatidylethanolamine-hydrolysing phospholipase D